MIDVGRICSACSRHRASLGPNRANSARIWPKSIQSRPRRPAFDEVLESSAPVGPSPEKIHLHPQNLRELGTGTELLQFSILRTHGREIDLPEKIGWGWAVKPNRGSCGKPMRRRQADGRKRVSGRGGGRRREARKRARGARPREQTPPRVDPFDWPNATPCILRPAPFQHTGARPSGQRKTRRGTRPDRRGSSKSMKRLGLRRRHLVRAQQNQSPAAVRASGTTRPQKKPMLDSGCASRGRAAELPDVCSGTGPLKVPRRPRKRTNRTRMRSSCQSCSSQGNNTFPPRASPNTVGSMFSGGYAPRPRKVPAQA